MKRNWNALKGRVNGTTTAVIKAAADQQKVMTLEIYGDIGASWWGDGITVGQITEILGEALDAGAGSLTIHINSPGGDAFEGVAIYNVLKDFPLPKTVIIDGLAASAASIIAMAGDTVHMGTGTMLMIHPAMMMAMGDSVAMRESATLLEKVTGQMAAIYSEKTGKGAPELLDLMYAETWMTPEEAVANGFADAKTEEPGNASELAADFDLTVFAKLPESLKPVEEPAEYVPNGELLKLRLKAMELHTLTGKQVAQ